MKRKPRLSISSDEFKPLTNLEAYLKLKYKGTFLKLVAVEEEPFIKWKDWASPTKLNFHLNDSFVSAYNHKFLDSDIDLLFDVFRDFFNVWGQVRSQLCKEEIEGTAPITYLSVFYRAKDSKILHFLFSVNGDLSVYLSAFHKLLKLINEYNQDQSALSLKINKTFAQRKGKRYFFVYDNILAEWQLIHPLLQIGKQFQRTVKGYIESREQKPMPLIQEDDYRNKIAPLPTNWRIHSDGFNFVMDKPNDVALYSSMAEKQLQMAETFLTSKLTELKKLFQDHAVRSKEELAEFFDYFENVIGAIIFSYTSIEAFANICIPDNYVKQVTKGGITYNWSKAEIEKRMELSEKLKKVLPDVLSTTPPPNNKWWNDFITLEELRNEIIHTKQATSEFRYTKLLSKKTFNAIRVNGHIIRFFGAYIALNKPRLLQEFPYGFGQDEIVPSITTASGYRDSIQVLHNVKILKPSRKKS